MAEPNVAEKVRKVVTETLVSEFELEPEKIVPAARLREDLGLDSLDGVDLIVALEKSLNVRIPENDARQMRTVGDIHAFIDKAVAAGSVEGAAAPNAP
ncbi:MAG: acyl carrier protein [Archangiaceae bacterium]|nr:acyl carrier protein [Archangiaceae bacterium]